MRLICYFTSLCFTNLFLHVNVMPMCCCAIGCQHSTLNRLFGCVFLVWHHHLRKANKSSVCTFRRFCLQFSYFLMFLNIQIDLIVLKTYDQQITLTTKNKSSAVAEMGDHLTTIGMGRKMGRATVGAGSPMGPHLTQCGLGQGLPFYQVASWSIQPFGHNCRNATLLRIGIRLWTIFIPSLVVKTFTGCVHWVIARYQLNSSK